MLVKIWTDTFIITGEIDTMRDERLTDYVRENKEFHRRDPGERDGSRRQRPFPHALLEREYESH